MYKIVLVINRDWKNPYISEAYNTSAERTEVIRGLAKKCRIAWDDIVCIYAIKGVEAKRSKKEIWLRGHELFDALKRV